MLIRREDIGKALLGPQGCWERERDREKEKESPVCFGGGLNDFFGGSPSRLPLANHLALSDLESTFSQTQGPPLCVPTSFSQDE